MQPKLTIVVTAQGLKMHGGTPETDIRQPDMEGLKKGLENLSKHLENLASFGQTVVVAFNKYAFDTQDEIDAVAEFCRQRGVRFAVNNAFVEGGQGAVEWLT